MLPYDNFTNIPFSSDNLDCYAVRSAIFNALKETLPQLNGNLLDIGCGKMPYKQYILQNSSVNRYVGLDIHTALIYDANVKPDITWDGIAMPINDESFDCAIATEVLEHCFEPNIILKETYRVLKPKSVFFFTVPFLWPLHEAPHDAYRYTPWTLERLLKQAGFSEIQLFALGGWHASMAQMLGLWVCRAGLSPYKKKILSYLLKPAISYLLHKDIRPYQFKESSMITGLYGIAKK
jgi:SAM-dependent methyltransferase